MHAAPLVSPLPRWAQKVPIAGQLLEELMIKSGLHPRTKFYCPSAKFWIFEDLSNIDQLLVGFCLSVLVLSTGYHNICDASLGLLKHQLGQKNHL